MQKTKTCRKCKKRKKISKFRKDRGKYRSVCKACAHNKHKQKYIKIKQYVWDYAKEKGCAHCDIKNPVVLEFHHIKNKTYNVSFMVKKIFPLSEIKKEIDKCIVLCSNCHKIHHAKELGFYKGIKK